MIILKIEPVNENEKHKIFDNILSKKINDWLYHLSRPSKKKLTLDFQLDLLVSYMVV
jgi:hypothetical protein